MFAVGGIVAAVAGFLLKAGDAKTMIAVGATLVLVDAAFRVSGRGEPNWVFSRTSGGFFFFLPVWVLGVLVVTLNALIGAGVLKK
jgi:hypothetical protein